MKIKRIISMFMAVALGSVVLAFPAQASVPSHQHHRDLAHTMVETSFYELDYDTQDGLCWGWNTGFEKQIFISELIDSMSGMGMSRADRRYGIISAFNEAC